MVATLASEMEGVPVEVVVRCGRLRAELVLEAEAFDADLVALAAPPETRLPNRVTRGSSGERLLHRKPR